MNPNELEQYDQDNRIHPEIRTTDNIVVGLPTREVLEQRLQQYTEWITRITGPPPGHNAVPIQCEPLNWTPLVKPLAESTVALVSTGGVHLEDQIPFDVYDRSGDWSFREISTNVDTSHLTVTHTHYAIQDALEDINVMFPIDRLHELAKKGLIGNVSRRHYGFMGFIPDPSLMLEDTAPAVANFLKDDGVDVVLLTPG